MEKWTYGTYTDKGNGANCIEMCKRNNAVCVNAFIRPKNNEHKRLATWPASCGNFSKQIGFFAIGAKKQNLYY